VRIWTAVGGISATLGPVLGGLLVQLDWRWVFFVNVPVGLAAIVVGLRWLPRAEGHPVPAPDGLGAALITVGVAALVLGLVDGSSWGWADARTVASLAGGTVGLALFAVHCGRHRNPLVDRELLRLRPFTGASIVAILFSASFGAMLLSRVLWAQDVWHWSALVTGLSIAPGPLMVPLFSFFVAGRLSARIGAGPVIALGSTIFAAGIVWWALAAGIHPDYVRQVLGGILLTGIGVGLALPTMMATGTASLPPHSLSTGSAVVNMFRQIGMAVGVAIFIAVLGSPGTPAAVLHDYRRDWIVVAAIAFVAAAASLVLLGARRTPASARSSTPAVAREAA
jgi:MFS family permease